MSDDSDQTAGVAGFRSSSGCRKSSQACGEQKLQGDFEGAADAKKASEGQAISLITELDILQKDAFRNPWKYGIGNENTPGKEKFTLTEENHELIKEKLIDELRTNTETGIYKSSFDNIYNNLMAENKVFIEQEYDENRSIEL